MNLELCRVKEADLEVISHIVFDGFAENPVNRVIYPNGATAAILAWNIEGDRRGLQEDKHAHYLCVKDVNSGAIISYALWYEYITERPKMSDDTPSEGFPPDSNKEAFEALDPISTVRREEIMGNRRYMYLADIVTTPTATRKGAASMLVDWGKGRADRLGVPCYLQGSPEGLSLYRKHGFHEIDKVVIDLCLWNSPVHEVVNLAMLRPAASERASTEA